MDVGFVGLGRMGLAMAHNLAKAGHRVRAWNRSGFRPEEAPGVEAAASASEAFAADVVLTMLSDDAAIRAVVLDGGLLAQARPSTVHVCTATISVAFADELRDAHAAAGVGYVSAPVFGRPDVAAAAQLGIVAAGPDEAVAKAMPLFDALGRKTWVMGRDPKLANATKLAGNAMIAMAIESMAEAATLVAGNGLDPAALFEVVFETQFSGSRAYANYGAKMLSGDFEAGFRMALGLKDLRLASEAGAASGRDLPMLAAVLGQMTRAVEAGHGERDWSAVADYTRRGG